MRRIRTRSNHAFTLIELLVVIGIIIGLAALIIPYLASSQTSARAARTIQNMNSIGGAIGAYANENDDQLPGWLDAEQFPVETAGKPPRNGQMLKYLADPLNIVTSTASGTKIGDFRDTAFLNPAWALADKDPNAPVFLINLEPVTPYNQPAFGTDSAPPLKRAALASWRYTVNGEEREARLPSIWALTEADAEVVQKGRIIGASRTSLMPKTAVFGKFRHALYFDFHVERLTIRERSTDQILVEPGK
jgi:type II secretory pathway pseudopilin PulG